MEKEPLLIGRELEVEDIVGHIGEAIAGKGSLTLISGEAGIGKTRVMKSSIDIAKKSGFSIFSGCCIPGDPCPYFPFIEAFGPSNQYLFGSRSREHGNERRDSSTVLFNVLDFLTKESKRTPIVICLEDLQWADSLSIQLLHFLARNIRPLRVSIIGTYRSEEMMVDSGEIVHPLIEDLRLMIREELVSQLPLKKLEDEACIQVIENMLNGSVKTDLAKQIVQECQGNPLFIVETTRLLLSSRNIEIKNGQWSISKGKHLGIPSTISEVILRRLERLPKETRRVLECASVIGKHFDPELIVDVLHLDRMNLLERLDSLENGFQLIHTVDDEYVFEHDLVQEVAYDRISSARKKEFHSQIGTLLEGKLPGERLFGALSYHYYLAGQKEKCYNYSIRAGENFLKESGGVNSATFFHWALDCIPAHGDNKKEQLRALLGLGDSLIEILDLNFARDAYKKALSLNLEPKEEGQILGRMILCSFPTYLGGGETTEAWHYINRASSLNGIDEIDAGLVLAYRANIETFEGNFEGARESYRKAMVIFETLTMQF